MPVTRKDASAISSVTLLPSIDTLLVLLFETFIETFGILVSFASSVFTVMVPKAFFAMVNFEGIISNESTTSPDFCDTVTGIKVEVLFVVIERFASPTALPSTVNTACPLVSVVAEPVKTVATKSLSTEAFKTMSERERSFASYVVAVIVPDLPSTIFNDVLSVAIVFTTADDVPTA